MLGKIKGGVTRRASKICKLGTCAPQPECIYKQIWNANNYCAKHDSLRYEARHQTQASLINTLQWRKLVTRVLVCLYVSGAVERAAGQRTVADLRQSSQ